MNSEFKYFFFFLDEQRIVEEALRDFSLVYIYNVKRIKAFTEHLNNDIESLVNEISTIIKDKNVKALVIDVHPVFFLFYD